MKSLFLIILLGLALAPASAEEAWVLNSQSDGVTIYTRVRHGSTIKEFKATGAIDAPPAAVLGVLDDVGHYTRFMPYVSECRILKREGDSLVSYQRISPPFCSERDYTLQVRKETNPTPAGPVYVRRWELANTLGPKEQPDTVRVKIDEGSWTLEPAAKNTTTATYRIYTDSGGALPAFIANKANQVGIGKLFEAIRKQAAKAK
jgi:hypothetical protein